MTRINVVPPSELTRQHLIAEYRELPRIFRLVRKAQERGKPLDSIPSQYTLGTGHVTFFYTRLEWLLGRYKALIVEMRIRGYKHQYDVMPLDLADLDACWFNDWVPDNDAITLNRQRIADRLSQMEV